MSASAAHIATSSCLEAFGALRSHLQAAKPDLAAQVTDADIEDEFGRFRLWAANIGALSRGHGSLDYRLRDAPVVLEGALKLLIELQQELHQMCLVLSGARLPYEAQISSRGGHVDDSDTSSLSSDSESSSDSSSDSDDEKSAPRELRRRVSALSNINDNLYRLSRSIRAPASHSRSLKALSYKLIDKETGVDVVQQYAPVDLAFTKDLYSQLRRNVQDQYGNCPMLEDADLAMIKRLAQGITRRRQQFLYWKHHRKKLGFNAEKDILKIPKPAPTVQLKGDGMRESVAGPRASLPVIGKAQTESSRPKTTLTETTATLFITPTTVPDGNQSVTSYATTARGLDGSRIEFPKLPKSIKKGKDFECPYCLMICPPHYQMPRAWRAHLLRDLRPYMCTHKHCQQSDELFATKQEWLNHEHTHQKAWQCPEHASTHFLTPEDLKGHLLAESHETLQRMGLEDLLAICETVRPDSRTTCPICFVDTGSPYSLENHLANHLERFAAFALPRDVDGDVDEESHNGSNMSEHAIARSDQSDASELSHAYDWKEERIEIIELAKNLAQIPSNGSSDAITALKKLYDQMTRTVDLPTEVMDMLSSDLQFKAVFKTIPKLLTDLVRFVAPDFDFDEDNFEELSSELIFQMERLDRILQEYAVDYALDSSHPRLGIDAVLPDQSSEDGLEQNQTDGELATSRDSSPDSVVNRTGPRLSTMDLNRSQRSGSAEETTTPIRDSSPDSIVNRTSSILSTTDLNRLQTSNPAEGDVSPTRGSSLDGVVHGTGPSLSTIDLSKAQGLMTEEEELLIHLREVQEPKPDWKTTVTKFNEHTGKNFLIPALRTRYARLKERLGVSVVGGDGLDDPFINTSTLTHDIQVQAVQQKRQDSLKGQTNENKNPPFIIANLTLLLTDAFRIQQRLRDFASEDKATPDAIVRLNRIFPDICLGITNLIKTMREGVVGPYAVTSIEVTDTRCRRLFDDASSFLDKFKEGTRPSWGSRTEYRNEIEQLLASAQRARQEIDFILEVQARVRGTGPVTEHGGEQDKPISRPSTEASILQTDNVEDNGGVSREGGHGQGQESPKSPRDTDDIQTPGLEDGSEVGQEASELSKFIAGQSGSSVPTRQTRPRVLDSNPQMHGRPIIIDERPLRGILKPGRGKFPEDPSPTREGVAPLRDELNEGIYLRPSRTEGAPPPGARWTKINRLLVNPEALDEGKERYEARDDFVIVLRVLSKEEIQAYADATVRIRAARAAEDDARDERRIKRIPPPSPAPEQDGSDGDDEGNNSQHERSHKRKLAQPRQTQQDNHENQNEGIPPDARWTKIDRKMVSPETLTQAGESFEERDDFVIVKRVLSQDEIEAYTEWTAKIRTTGNVNTFYSREQLSGYSQDDVEYGTDAPSRGRAVENGTDAPPRGRAPPKRPLSTKIGHGLISPGEGGGSTVVHPARIVPGAVIIQEEANEYNADAVLIPPEKPKRPDLLDRADPATPNKDDLAGYYYGYVRPPNRELVPIQQTLRGGRTDGGVDVVDESRWTKINRKFVSPEALDRAQEKYFVWDHYVIVHRILSREEVDAYTTASTSIRAARADRAEEDDNRHGRSSMSTRPPQPSPPRQNDSGRIEAKKEGGWGVPDSWLSKTDNMPMSERHDEEPRADDVLGERPRPSSPTSSLFDDDVVLNPHTLRRGSMDTSHHMDSAGSSHQYAKPDDSAAPSLALVFPCTFAFAGCSSAFSSKDYWKRHVASNHMSFVYWECPLKPCPRPLFHTEDLLEGHLKWVHETSDNEMAALVKKGERPGRSPITETRCPAPGCDHAWSAMGNLAWDERMEHVARHWEAVERGEEVGGWTEEGGGLLEWAIREGAIVKLQGGRLMCQEALGLGPPKRPNDEKRSFYGDVSSSSSTHERSPSSGDHFEPNPFTGSSTTDPTTPQTTNRGEGKPSVKFAPELRGERHHPSSSTNLPMPSPWRTESAQASESSGSDWDYDADYGTVHRARGRSAGLAAESAEMGLGIQYVTDEERRAARERNKIIPDNEDFDALEQLMRREEAKRVADSVLSLARASAGLSSSQPPSSTRSDLDHDADDSSVDRAGKGATDATTKRRNSVLSLTRVLARLSSSQPPSFTRSDLDHDADDGSVDRAGKGDTDPRLHEADKVSKYMSDVAADARTRSAARDDGTGPATALETDLWNAARKAHSLLPSTRSTSASAFSHDKDDEFRDPHPSGPPRFFSNPKDKDGIPLYPLPLTDVVDETLVDRLVEGRKERLKRVFSRRSRSEKGKEKSKKKDKDDDGGARRDLGL
ncbi:hypothetical protein VE03_03872 [Pseudogymnoascus sp. 23342-1-I1]|nr:hypothetical protein VE03_03872 [Pseudogymnoascus sp. 23342-1-I1]